MIIVLPEMLEAAEQALAECRQMDLSERQMIIEIYMAMEGMREIIAARNEGMVH